MASEAPTTRERVLTAIGDLGSRASYRAIAEAVHVTPRYARIVIDEMIDAGDIEKHGRGMGRELLPAVGRPTVRRRSHRRHASVHADRPGDISGLPAAHPAVTQGRTLFPSRVFGVDDVPRLLIDGFNSRKIGRLITKGAWKSFRVYTLTLEERATCPTTCPVWRQCYGNGMPFARRIDANPAGLFERLDAELSDLARRHRYGFAVRIHNLGDFASVGHVRFWELMLDAHPALRCFGFTAWPAGTPIGDAVAALRDSRWDRFAIRTSGAPGPGPHSAVIRRVARGRQAEGVVCPAQTSADVTCGSCGLCWAPAMRETPIVFMMHGQ